jgi:hypothetical protein
MSGTTDESGTMHYAARGWLAGVDLGVLLVRSVARHHTDNDCSQLARGGWVSPPDEAAEQVNWTCSSTAAARRCIPIVSCVNGVSRTRRCTMFSQIRFWNAMSDGAHRRNAWQPTAQTLRRDTAFATRHQTARAGVTRS